MHASSASGKIPSRQQNPKLPPLELLLNVIFSFFFSLEKPVRGLAYHKQPEIDVILSGL